ncbi:hypothetical protein D3C73_1503080 [compost metagenome]
MHTGHKTRSCQIARTGACLCACDQSGDQQPGTEGGADDCVLASRRISDRHAYGQLGFSIGTFTLEMNQVACKMHFRPVEVGKSLSRAAEYPQ